MGDGGVPVPEPSFRALVESSPDGIVIHEAGRVVYANAALAALLGVDDPAELIGRNVLEAVHPDDLELVVDRVRRLAAGEAITVPATDQRFVRRDGSVVHVSVRGVRLEVAGRPCICAIIRDVTEQRRLEARLLETDRMVALGTLSAGIAHEVANPLTYLSLHLESVAATLQRLRPLVDGDAAGLVERLAHHLGIVQDGAARVRDIIRELRVFARATDEERRPVDVRAALRRALTMTAHELRPRAAIVTDLAEVPPVLATEGRLVQVFVNLLLNAAHAIGDGDPGVHQVEVRTWTEPGADGAAGTVWVSIRDTGDGIGAEHLPRIFDPFFTTKPVGEGTGLGLAIVHGIVTGLGGAVRVDSRRGAGATFVVALPAAAARDQPNDRQ